MTFFADRSIHRPGFRNPDSRKPHASRRSTRRFTPQVAGLESRALLSAITVTNDADSGPGSLRAALASPAADTIRFAASAYGTITLTSGPLEVSTSVKIQGPGANLLTISGNNSLQVFQVDAGVTSTLSGLTIANGLAPSSTLNGGGVVNEGTLTVDRCVFTSDSAPSGFGGGIENDGTLTVKDSTFENNSAQSGGAIYNTATVTLKGSTFDSNTAALGGVGGAIASALYTGGLAQAAINNCTISGNTSADGGGSLQRGHDDDQQQRHQR